MPSCHAGSPEAPEPADPPLPPSICCLQTLLLWIALLPPATTDYRWRLWQAGGACYSAWLRVCPRTGSAACCTLCLMWTQARASLRPMRSTSTNSIPHAAANCWPVVSAATDAWAQVPRIALVSADLVDKPKGITNQLREVLICYGTAAPRSRSLQLVSSNSAPAQFGTLHAPLACVCAPQSCSKWARLATTT